MEFHFLFPNITAPGPCGWAEAKEANSDQSW